MVPQTSSRSTTKRFSCRVTRMSGPQISSAPMVVEALLKHVRLQRALWLALYDIHIVHQNLRSRFLVRVYVLNLGFFLNSVIKIIL